MLILSLTYFPQTLGQSGPAPEVPSTQKSNRPLVQNQKVNSSPEVYVDPILGLDQLIENFRTNWASKEKNNPSYNLSRKKWADFKASDQRIWPTSKQWMKSPEEYKKMTTKDLADDVFLSNSVFSLEAGLYHDPTYALITLEIMHDGFSELFSRDDMWVGVLHVYDSASAKLNSSSNLSVIQRASGTLSALEILYQLPKFKQQVTGREREFLKAHLVALDRFNAYTTEFDPQKLGTPTPFYAEPVAVARMALVLSETIDHQRFLEVQNELSQIKWGHEQKMLDIKNYLDLVSTRLKTFQ